MTKRVVGKFGRLALWFSPVVIVAVGFLVVLWWTKPKNPVVVEAMTAVAAIFVLSYTHFLGKRESRRWDEVQRAGWGFASGSGGWGTFVTMVLLMVPPVMNWLIGLVNAVVAAAQHAAHRAMPPDVANHLAVQLAFWFGIMLVILMQAVASVVAHVVWWRRMSS
jgi:hypothetical protein